MFFSKPLKVYHLIYLIYLDLIKYVSFNKTSCKKFYIRKWMFYVNMMVSSLIVTFLDFYFKTLPSHEPVFVFLTSLPSGSSTKQTNFTIQIELPTRRVLIIFKIAMIDLICCSWSRYLYTRILALRARAVNSSYMFY